MTTAVSLWVAVASLIGTGVLAATTLIGKRAEVGVVADGNLRDDQREFIAMLRSDNAELRGRVAVLEEQERRLSRRIVMLEVALRAANIPIPDFP